jgi:hypothetical protein
LVDKHCHEERRARKMNIMARCAIYTPFLEIEASFIFYDEVTPAALRACYGSGGAASHLRDKL